MKCAPLFLSIIIPVYNVEAFLGECLDSCLVQDLPHDRYEIICVDDGSTDKSGAILDAYAEKYGNLTVLHQKNGGVSAARNSGLDRARGEYVWFVDPDDFIQDDFLMALLAVVEQNGQPHMVTFGMYAFGDYRSDCELTPEERAHKRELKNNRSPNETYDATLCRHLYKREIFETFGIRFDPEILCCEDNVVHFLFDGRAKTGAYLEETGYFYRRRTGSLSSGNAEKYYESRVRIAMLFLTYYREMYGNHYIAGYMLTSQLKMALAHIAKMKNPRRRLELQRLKELGLYPLKIDPSDTYYEKKRDEKRISGRLYNKAYNSDYTRFGYAGLRYFVLQKKIAARLPGRG